MEIKKILIASFIVSALILALVGCTNDKAAYVPFAQCLTEKGVKMYGSFRCPHCLNQKKMFGTAFEHITYVECDPLSRIAQRAECEAQKIEGYPTWVFADGSRESGELTFEKLSEKSGCALPTEPPGSAVSP